VDLKAIRRRKISRVLKNFEHIQLMVRLNIHLLFLDDEKSVALCRYIKDAIETKPLSPDYVEEGFAVIKRTFFLEETVSRAYGITDNPATLAEG
jgi:hypothetical protein